MRVVFLNTHTLPIIYRSVACYDRKNRQLITSGRHNYRSSSLNKLNVVITQHWKDVNIFVIIGNIKKIRALCVNEWKYFWNKQHIHTKMYINTWVKLSLLHRFFCLYSFRLISFNVNDIIICGSVNRCSCNKLIKCHTEALQ